MSGTCVSSFSMPSLAEGPVGLSRTPVHVTLILPLPDTSESLVLVAWRPLFSSISQQSFQAYWNVCKEWLGNEYPIPGVTAPSLTPRGFGRSYRLRTAKFEVRGRFFDDGGVLLMSFVNIRFASNRGKINVSVNETLEV